MKKIGLFYIACLLIVAFLPNSLGQEYTHWHLPEGATARLGKGKIKDVKFSSDGARLAVATDIGIWVYNAHTGAEIALVKRQPLGISAVNIIAFAPDGTTLAFGSGGLGRVTGTVELWDTTTGERLTVLGEDMGSVEALEFSDDGTTLASASWSGTRKMKYYLWEIATGREVLSFTKARGRIPLNKGTLVLSQAPHSVASTDMDTVKIWDVATEELRQTFAAADGNTTLALAFSPDGKTLAGSYVRIRLWDTETGDERSELDGHSNGVHIMTFSPDGKILASGDTVGKVILWDLDSPNPKPLRKKSTLPSLLRSITDDKNNRRENSAMIEHTLSIEGLDFTSDSRRLVTGSQDGAAIVWEAETRNRLFTVNGHTGTVKALAFLEDDKTLISASADGTLRIWETDTGSQQLIPIKHKRSIFCMALSADRKMVAIGGVGNDVHLWNADTKNFVATFKTGHPNYVDTLAFSPDDKILASGSRDRKVELWDVANHQRLSILDGYTDGIISMTFSADGKKFASTSRDGTAHLWDLDTEKKTALRTAPDSGVNSLAFSPDSSLLLSACWDERIRLWDANTHQHIADAIVSPKPRHLEFSPDGKTVVTGTERGLIQLWDVDTRTVSHQIRMGDAAQPTAFAFTQDGKTLVSGNSDGTIFIWDLEHITGR